MKTSRTLGALALLLAPLAAHAGLNIVVTTTDLGAITEAVAGDHAKIVTLAKGTEDAHEMRAKPSFAIALARADLLVEGGANLEGEWLPPLVDNARNPAIATDAPGRFAATKAAALRLRDVPVGVITASECDSHPLGNPHYMLDPDNARRVALALGAHLAKLDPDNASDYRMRAAGFDGRVAARTADWEKRLAPFAGTKVVPYHGSFDYFLARFRLVKAGTVEPKPGVEPTPAHILALAGRMRKEGVKLVVAEAFRPAALCRKLAGDAGAVSLTLPDMVGGAPGVLTYEDLIEYDVAAVEKALKK